MSQILRLQRKIQEFLSDIHERTGIPGISVALTVDGFRMQTAVGTASGKSGAPLSSNSRFQSGCITKMITCLVVLELARSRTLNLDAPVGEYLREFNDLPKGRSITIRHLASHTSGYQGLNLANTENAYFFSWDKFVEFFRNTAQTFPPGVVFNYEHSECIVLGEVVRRVTGLSPDRIARDLIFDPLGVSLGTVKTDANNPHVHVVNHVFDPGSGGYKSLSSVPYCAFWAHSLSDSTISTSDLASLGEALIGMADCRLRIDTIAEAQRQIVRIPSHIRTTRGEQMPISFGFGCAEYSGHLIGHNGSARGQTCGIRFDPACRMVIVVAMNAWQPYLRDLILNSIAEEVRPHDVTREIAAEDWTLQEIEGTYAGCIQGVSLVASMEDDRLVCRLSNLSAKTIAVMALSRDTEGRLTLESDTEHLSVGYFREETSGSSCMMVGLNAFRKSH